MGKADTDVGSTSAKTPLLLALLCCIFHSWLLFFPVVIYSHNRLSFYLLKEVGTQLNLEGTVLCEINQFKMHVLYYCYYLRVLGWSDPDSEDGLMLSEYTGREEFGVRTQFLISTKLKVNGDDT